MDEQIRMLTDDGVEEFEITVGSDAARIIGQHWNAVQHFLHTGETDRLNQFATTSIGGRRFAVDPDWIERWAARGELDFEDIYESGT
ncbi:MAG: hypothetical protein ACR2ND_05065 [Solirubrobacteraceae bacterium]